MNFPASFINAINECKTNNLAKFWPSGHTALFILFLSGIRQGCPASGSIFALSVDPVIRKIYSSDQLRSLKQEELF